MGCRTQYAIYRGDEFIDLGTARELAQRLKLSYKSIHKLTTPKKHETTTNRGLLAYRIEDDEDEN